MAYRFPNARIAVFARAPVAGRVKTRLIAALGAEGAAQLYAAMLGDLLSRLRVVELAPPGLFVSENPSHESFITLCNKKEIYLQEGEDLGQRMAHASASVLAAPEVDSVVVIGSDCPALSTAQIGRALQALADGREVVLVPAEDGGYGLVGLRAPRPELFRGIDWGSERVLEQTLARARQCNLDVCLEEPIWDVDRVEDLLRLAALGPQWASLLMELRR